MAWLVDWIMASNPKISKEQEKTETEYFVKFIENQTDFVHLDLDFEECLPNFISLFRYYRLKHFPDSPSLQKITQRERELADECHSNFIDFYQFLEPIYEKITHGSSNEGVGILSQKRLCTIVRRREDVYQISVHGHDNIINEIPDTGILLVTSDM